MSENCFPTMCIEFDGNRHGSYVTASFSGKRSLDCWEWNYARDESENIFVNSHSFPKFLYIFMQNKSKNYYITLHKYFLSLWKVSTIFINSRNTNSPIVKPSHE